MRVSPFLLALRVWLPAAVLLAFPAAAQTKGKKPSASAVAKPAAVTPAPPVEAAAPITAPVPAVSPAKRETPAAAPPAAPAPKDATDIAKGPKRLGVMLDLYGEGSRLGAEQWINNTRRDESFNYGSGIVSATAYLLFQQTERLRAGPAIRFFGNYGGASGNDFKFGLLSEALVLAEYSLSAFELVDAVFGGRGGVAVLIPGSDFGEEISRLQREGAGVWSLPRVGWTVGANAGLRRPLVGSLYARADFNVGLSHLFLFSTNEVVDGLHFQKYWGTDMLRLGLTLGVEVAF